MSTKLLVGRFATAASLWLAACGPGSSPPPDGDDASAGGGTDASTQPAPTTPGYQMTLGGMDYQSAPGTSVVIGAETNSGVYDGRIVARSDQASVPNVEVSLRVPDGMLASGATFPCQRASGADPTIETAVLIHWLDGDTYYTNVQPSPACTVTVTSASDTSVALTVTGTIYDEMAAGHPATSLSLTLVAAVQR